MKRTPFGTMLTNYRFYKSEIIRKARNSLWERNKLDSPTKREDYEIRESTVHAQDGSTVTKLELWHRVDSERVKISTSVQAEILKDDVKVEEQKDDDDWGI